MSVGVLVYGDNHLILQGPRPTAAQARTLAAHFGLSLARIAPRIDRSGEFAAWRISSREFRENLTWAVRLPAATLPGDPIVRLLQELSGRGISIHLLEESPCVV